MKSYLFITKGGFYDDKFYRKFTTEYKQTCNLGHEHVEINTNEDTFDKRAAKDFAAYLFSNVPGRFWDVLLSEMRRLSGQ